jgi:hypothetical protein
MWRFRLNFKKAIFLFIVAVVLVEIVARLIGLGDPPLVELDDKIEYMLLPDRQYVRFGNSIRINKFRMRSAPFDMEKSPNEIRIILFGDSVVYGNHFIDQADTIASNLERQIAGSALKAPVSVGSVAASSWGPPNLLAFVERYGTFNGDIAVVVLSHHDIVDVPSFDEDVIPYRTASPISASHDLLEVLLERIKRRVIHQKSQPYSIKRAVSINALGKFIGILKENFTTVLFLYHPNREKPLNCDNDVTKTYQDISNAHGIAFNSLCTAYLNAQDRGIAVYSDEIHLSRDGTQVFSQFILQNLRRLNEDGFGATHEKL